MPIYFHFSTAILLIPIHQNTKSKFVENQSNHSKKHVKFTRISFRFYPDQLNLFIHTSTLKFPNFCPILVQCGVAVCSIAVLCGMSQTKPVLLTGVDSCTAKPCCVPAAAQN